MTVVDVAGVAPLDPVAAADWVDRLDRTATVLDRCAVEAGAATAPCWWGAADEAYEQRRRAAADRSALVAAQVRALRVAVSGFVDDAGAAVRAWRAADDDLRRARALAAVVVGDALDPRPTGLAEEEALRRRDRAGLDHAQACRVLGSAAAAVVDALHPVQATPEQQLAAVTGAALTVAGLGFLEPAGRSAPSAPAAWGGAPLHHRAVGRGAIEALVDTARAVPDLLVLLANRSLAQTGSPQLPSLRFAFEGDLQRGLDEVTGACTLDTNPACASYRGAGYVAGTAAVSVGPVGGGVRSAGRSVLETGLVVPTTTVRTARLADSKFDFVFGRVAGHPHNGPRSQQLARSLDAIGLHDDPVSRAYLRRHLDDVVVDDRSVVSNYQTEHGSFEIRESLLAGPFGLVKIETAWQIRGDSRSLVTIIPFGKRS